MRKEEIQEKLKEHERRIKELEKSFNKLLHPADEVDDSQYDNKSPAGTVVIEKS